jgi:hypothetical protein
MSAPRLGLAYNLTDKTMIRSGYGITYDPMPLGQRPFHAVLSPSGGHLTPRPQRPET